MKRCLEIGGQHLAPYVEARAVETEGVLAWTHLALGVTGLAVSLVLAYHEQFTLVTSDSLYLAGLGFFMLYALVYALWAPYRRFPLELSAGLLVLLDLAIVTLIILNTGGIGSTFWGLWAAVALTYILRFRTGWSQLLLLVLLFLSTAALSLTYVPPADPVPLSVNLAGVVFSMAAILAAGFILASLERKAIREGLIAECMAIQRVINTVQHEVNNPLTVASGSVHILQDKLEKTAAQECRPSLENIRGALERIRLAVERLDELEQNRLVEAVGPVEWFTRAIRKGRVPEEVLEGAKGRYGQERT